ncbi:MAG: hypothetical protein NVS1B14_12380 [Vulcanimicrobiaceae bacterium]
MKLVTISLLLAGISYAASLNCTPNTPTNVTITGTLATSTSLASIVCGPATFSTFSSLDASGGTTTGTPVSFLPGISNYNAATGLITLALNPNLNGGGYQDTHLLFNVVSTMPITAVGLNVGGAGTGVIGERLCTGGIANVDSASGLCAPGSAQLGYLAASLGQSASTSLSMPATQIGVFKDIGVVDSSLSSVSQTFQTQPSNVPEPNSTVFAMIGFALAGIAYVRRTRKR